MRPRLIGFLVLVVLTAAACGREATPAHQGSAHVTVTIPTAKPAYAKHLVAAAALLRYSNCAAVTKSLRTDALRYVTPYGLSDPGSYGTFATGVMSGGAVIEDKTAGAAQSGAVPAAAPSAPTAGVDYSTTNVQEAGVDEPDLVETDGHRIFAVANQTLHAAVIENDTPRLVGALHLDSADAQLLLAGNRLIILGSDAAFSPPVEPMGRGLAMSMPIAYSEKTLVQIVDVSDPAAMRIDSTLHLDGSYVAARAVNGIVRIVVRRSSPNIGFATPNDGAPATITHALTVNRDLVSKAGIDKWIPRYALRTSGVTTSGPLSSCNTTYHPPVFSGLSTVTVVTVDPAHPTPQNGSTVVGGGETVYASQDALYVTAQKWDPPQPIAMSSGGAVAPAAPCVASAAPGVVGPGCIAVPSVVETQIHKFSITGPSASYLASGIVSGTLLNQFAMSEWNGNLRVASTTNSYTNGSQASSSAVTVFAQKGEALVPVGHVGGLGSGEQIRGVRFIGPVGYVVTFQQTDPLYTVDLSNPVAPKVAGVLKIPGFSAYLHPVGDGLILGVGEVADAQGHVHDIQGHWFGTKVSLFDVHDPAHPIEVATHVISGGQSAAENDSHAFLWWAPRKLAVIPISSYDANSFRGAVGMHVDRTITEVGRIADPNTQSQNYFDPGIQRAFVVGDRLFTLSATGLRSSDISSFTLRTWLPFGS